MSKILVTMIVVFGLGSNAYAACAVKKLVGPWDVAFSDGNSCRLHLTTTGDINVNKSSCYDPFRGVTIPDSGSFEITKECEISATLSVEGLVVDLAGQLAMNRILGAGGFVVPAFEVKGGFTMIRLP